MCRYEQLISALESLGAQPDQHAERSIGDITTELEDNALSVTSILITLPFLQPFPIGIFALIGSATYWSIALQLLKGRQQLSLPSKVKHFKLKVSTTKKLISTCLWFIHPIHRIAKPRLNFLTQPQRLNKLGSLIFFLLAHWSPYHLAVLCHFATFSRR